MDNKTLLKFIFKTNYYTYNYIMQSSIGITNSSVHNTDEPIITANVVTEMIEDTNTIQIADIATTEDINSYSLEILDTEHGTRIIDNTLTEHDIKNIIFQIIHNTQFRMNVCGIEPMYSFLKKRSHVLEYYILLFIINLIYNVTNIFNIVLFIPLLYYLFVILYPTQIHLEIIPYSIILSIIINISITIGITFNIYIFGIHYIQYITPMVHTGIILYITTLYLTSLTNTFIQCIFLRHIIYLKRYYIKLETYLLHDIITQNPIA